MYRKFGLLFPGKARNLSTALSSFPSPCMQCFRVSIPPAVRPTYRYGIFNMHTNLCECHTHKGGVQSTKQDCTTFHSEGQKNSFSPFPTRGFFKVSPGSLDWNSNSLTTSWLSHIPHHWSGLLFKGRHEIFNVCNDLSECCAHKGEAGTDESTQWNCHQTWLDKSSYRKAPSPSPKGILWKPQLQYLLIIIMKHL